jgi:lipopolysaccharide/colanic/teichoic acid biosynthesis glycosyltransferase
MRETGRKTAWKPILSQVNGRRRKGGIYSENELRELVVYERARADRTGDSLSLVLCDMTRLNGYGPSKSEVVSALVKSIRTTDHLGWFGKSTLGVILPLTDQTGAARFVETLTANGHSPQTIATSDLEFSVHSYPDKWITNGTTPERETRAGMKQCVTNFARPIPRWKRALDIALAGVGLLLLFPFLVLLGLYIKVVSPGPVLFRQKRVGYARREFTFYKFRTMHHNNNTVEHSHHLKDLIHFDKPMAKLDSVDPRIIPGGRILRKLSVDELPQILNVLKGDMSLVGPRPCIPYEADEYLQWHSGRFSVLPGITGLWQVSGKNKLTFQQMIRLDIEYERRCSLLFDLWIILKTFPTLAGLALEGIGNRLRPGRFPLDAETSPNSDTGSEIVAS